MEAGLSGPISQLAPLPVVEATKLAPELATPQAPTLVGNLALGIVQKPHLAALKSVQLVSSLNLRLFLWSPQLQHRPIHPMTAVRLGLLGPTSYSSHTDPLPPKNNLGRQVGSVVFASTLAQLFVTHISFRWRLGRVDI